MIATCPLSWEDKKVAAPKLEIAVPSIHAAINIASGRSRLLIPSKNIDSTFGRAWIAHDLGSTKYTAATMDAKILEAIRIMGTCDSAT